MSGWAMVAFGVPLAGGAASLLLRTAAGRLRLARACGAAMLLASLVLSAASARGEVTVVEFGGWAAPLGVSFSIDRLSCLFLVLLSLVLAATLWTLDRRADAAKVRRLVPALLFLAAALAGAFSTDDLFNLFVMFELVLLSSYLLLQSSGRWARRDLPAYVSLNVVASLLFFTGAGVLYAIGGSLSVDQLGPALAQNTSPWKATALALLALAFSTKAGLVPLLFWLPRTYPQLFGPIAALFAGMMTKLGVYALIRTAPLMVGTPLPEVLLWAGAVTSLLGVLAAQAQTRFRELLCYHVVSQVGFMVAGVGLASVAGWAAAMLYVGHHVLVKSALFLIADQADPRDGSTVRPSAGLSAAFLLAGLSLAGLPPLSGFLGKVAVFQALMEQGRWVPTLLLLISSFFTLASMLKLWRGFFFRPTAAGTRLARTSGGISLLVAASLLFAALAGPGFRFASSAAQQLTSAPTAVTEIDR